METFPLPELLPIRDYILYTGVGSVVAFIIIFFIWRNLDKKSKGRKVLPHIAGAICLIGIAIVGYLMTIGTINNETQLKNSIVRNYNVDVIAGKIPEVTVIKGETVRTCEMRSDDQINYIVQCPNPDGGVTNLKDIGAG